MTRPGKDVHLWLEPAVAETLQTLAEESHATVKDTVMDLLKEALAMRVDTQTFRPAMPTLQGVIHTEIAQQNADLPALVAAAVQQAEQVRYHDITTLLIRAIHQAGLAWRLTYVSLALNIPEADLKRVFDEAEQRVLEQLQHLDIKGAER